MEILRDPRTCKKWCVSENEFPGRTYPQYCAGIGYIISSPLVPLLYNASHYTPFFWIDDVYVTGLLAKKLPAGVKYVDTLKHFTLDADEAIGQYQNRSEPVKFYFVHPQNEEKFTKLWRLAIERITPEQRLTVNDRITAQWTS